MVADHDLAGRGAAGKQSAVESNHCRWPTADKVAAAAAADSGGGCYGHRRLIPGPHRRLEILAAGDTAVEENDCCGLSRANDDYSDMGGTGVAAFAASGDAAANDAAVVANAAVAVVLFDLEKIDTVPDRAGGHALNDSTPTLVAAVDT